MSAPDPTGGFLGMRRRPPAPTPAPAATPEPPPAARPAQPVGERAKVLAAIADLSARGARTTVAAVALRAWRLWPESFSLAETDGEHPDSAKVVGRIADLVARGQVTRSSTGLLRLAQRKGAR